MEKKTRFKLNFIKSHINKTQRKHNKKFIKFLKSRKTFQNNDSSSQQPLILYKYFNPITVHRIVGDLIFLDSLCNYDDLIPLTSLWTPFKNIQEIITNEEFSVCKRSDSGYFTSNVEFLVQRLLSLGDSACYNLAKSIMKFSKVFNDLPLAKEKQKPVYSSMQQLNAYLFENKNNPIILYNYQSHPFLGMINLKISMNKVIKNMTFQDDIRIFEESIFVVPKEYYFSYMINHLENCFNQNDEIMTLYLNSCQGVKRMYAKGMNFTMENETIVVIVFPKELQTKDVAELYESNFEQKEIKIEKKKNNLVKSFRDWENLIKMYYDPDEIDQAKKRCKYRVIEKRDENIKNFSIINN